MWGKCAWWCCLDNSMLSSDCPIQRKGLCCYGIWSKTFRGGKKISPDHHLPSMVCWPTPHSVNRGLPYEASSTDNRRLGFLPLAWGSTGWVVLAPSPPRGQEDPTLAVGKVAVAAFSCDVVGTPHEKPSYKERVTGIISQFNRIVLRL